MSSYYLFPQSGSAPGIPGTFAHCRVDIAEDGTQTVTPWPLVPHDVAETPAQEAEQENEAPEEQSKQSDSAKEKTSRERSPGHAADTN